MVESEVVGCAAEDTAYGSRQAVGKDVSGSHAVEHDKQTSSGCQRPAAGQRYRQITN